MYPLIANLARWGQVFSCSNFDFRCSFCAPAGGDINDRVWHLRTAALPELALGDEDAAAWWAADSAPLAPLVEEGAVELAD